MRPAVNTANVRNRNDRHLARLRGMFELDGRRLQMMLTILDRGDHAKLSAHVGYTEAPIPRSDDDALALSQTYGVLHHYIAPIILHATAQVTQSIFPQHTMPGFANMALTEVTRFPPYDPFGPWIKDVAPLPQDVEAYLLLWGPHSGRIGRWRREFPERVCNRLGESASQYIGSAGMRILGFISTI